MPKHVHLVTASNGSKEWSQRVNTLLGCAKCQTSIYQTMKHQNATVQSYASACVLRCNLRSSLTEQLWPDRTLSSFILSPFFFFTINASLLLTSVFRFLYIFLELSCLIFPFCLLQLQTTLLLYHKQTKGSLNQSRIQSKRISSSVMNRLTLFIKSHMGVGTFFA